MGSLGEIVKIIGVLGEGDAENGGLNNLTYVSPPEWEPHPSPGKTTFDVQKFSSQIDSRS